MMNANKVSLKPNEKHDCENFQKVKNYNLINKSSVTLCWPLIVSRTIWKITNGIYQIMLNCFTMRKLIFVCKNGLTFFCIGCQISFLTWFLNDSSSGFRSHSKNIPRAVCNDVLTDARKFRRCSDGRFRFFTVLVCLSSKKSHQIRKHLSM